MKIAQKYSQFNAEEYFIAHDNDLFGEIKEIIARANAEQMRTKLSKERGTEGSKLYIPLEINRTFKCTFHSKGWRESYYRSYITLIKELMEKNISLPSKQQKV